MPKEASHLVLTPSQQSALDKLLTAVESKVCPIIELRSPPNLARGHGITTILRSAAQRLEIPLLNIATVLDDPKGVECAVQTIYKKAHASLVERGVAIIDDLDCAVAPRYLSRNRTLVGETKGAGQVYNWNLSPEPAMLLKALTDVASDKQGVLIFSAIEDQHLAFVQGAQTVTLSEPTVSDYSTIVASVLGDQRTVTPASIFALHSQLGAADLSRHCRAASSAESVMASICSDLVSTSAVAPEEVESVDLAAFPGLGEIKQKIEQHVLFPLENHDAAAEVCCHSPAVILPMSNINDDCGCPATEWVSGVQWIVETSAHLNSPPPKNDHG
jgi:hypothetical protein